MSRSKIKTNTISKSEITELFDAAGFKLDHLDIEEKNHGSKAGVKIKFRLVSGEHGTWNIMGVVGLHDSQRARIATVKQIVANARRATFG
ncbi:MAG: hypothetical protein JO110_01350 [Acetobacteraceae bacterium]|nr:hypothetical protein [Acetobacteraceae bacterium]